MDYFEVIARSGTSVHTNKYIVFVMFGNTVKLVVLITVFIKFNKPTLVTKGDVVASFLDTQSLIY